MGRQLSAQEALSSGFVSTVVTADTEKDFLMQVSGSGNLDAICTISSPPLHDRPHFRWLFLKLFLRHAAVCLSEFGGILCPGLADILPRMNTRFCRDVSSLVDGFWLQYGRAMTDSIQSYSRYPGFQSKILTLNIHAEIPGNCPLSLSPGKYFPGPSYDFFIYVFDALQPMCPSALVISETLWGGCILAGLMKSSAQQPARGFDLRTRAT